jgi:hypothetical protein
MTEKMKTEEKKKDLEEMLAVTENMSEIEKAHVMGYVKGMSAASELKKKEAS